MRPRFGVAPDAYSAYQPQSYDDALFPGNRKYYYYTPTQERKGMPCPIVGGFQPKPIPAIHLAAKRRDAPPAVPPPSQHGPPHQQQAAPQPASIKQWVTMTGDTDAVLAAQASSTRAAVSLMMSSYRSAVASGPTSSNYTSNESDNTKEVLALISGTAPQSHATDFVSTCVYGPGGSSCASVGSELFRDCYLFLSRRGYSAPIAIGGSSGKGGEGGDDDSGGASGGTVRATFAAMLNPLLDPAMSCTAVNNMLPPELRIYRAPDGSSTTAAIATDDNDYDADGGGAAGDEVTAHGTHKASTSSSFLFSKNPKVFRIKPSKPFRIEKPIRRGGAVTMGGLLVPSLGGKGLSGTRVGGAAADGGAAKAGGRGKKSSGAAGDDEDISLADKFGSLAGIGMGGDGDDDFSFAAPTVGSKRARDGTAVMAIADGEEGRVDDGGDGAESNGDADTNSLSSFSGDDDDNEDMSDGGNSDGELYL